MLLYMYHGLRVTKASTTSFLYTVADSGNFTGAPRFNGSFGGGLLKVLDDGGVLQVLSLKQRC